MSLKFKQFFSVLVVLMVGLAAFNFSFSSEHPLKVNEAQAVNVWGDWFDRTVGAKGFADIGFGRKDPRAIIANVVNILFGFLGVLAILLILYGGFIWMTAGGNPEKIDQAKAILRNASIGLLIVLSSFALAIYILSRLLLATTGSGGKFGGGNGQGAGALGALGAGIVKSVYPAPEQKDVPRNTSIIITFREEIDPASICDQVAAGRCADGTKINAKNIRIYKTDQGDQDATNITGVKVVSNDNKVFVFSPEAYLGSPSEKLWYSVALTEAVKKKTGGAAFSLGGFQWKFEVSNKLDLTPPQVLSGGVFPTPDNAKDTAGSIKDATQAKGSIEVKRVPQVFVANSVSYVKTNPLSVEINVDTPSANTCDGQIDISINNTTPLSANVAYRNLPGKIDVPQAAILNREIITACGFKVVLDPGAAVGHSWRLTMASQKQPDYLLIGNSRYVFVAQGNLPPKVGEIVVNNNLNTLAANIKTALTGDPSVSADAVGNKVILTAKTAGRLGNSLALMSSADFSVLGLDPIRGGTDKEITINVVDKADKPKNSIIQINFNEAVNPINVSGPSAAVANFIKVVNLTDNSQVAGEFVVSNQYKTVEFIPANECGVNGCGDKVYCLPSNSQLRVELTAAALAATCAGDSDCVIKTPYNTCTGGVCTDSKTNTKYPEGKQQSGIMDLANNSLDGNRNGSASGPLSFFDENLKNLTEGDSYRWSFWISDRLDLEPPQIIRTDAAQGAEGVDLIKQVMIFFNKLMMASTLSSGSITVDNGEKKVSHKLINLWSQSKEPIGYWIEKDNKDTSVPPDNEADQTIALISHSSFNASTIYRAQVGSGVKDIYQNCFKPCRGPGCEANQSSASCCNGVPTQIGDNGTCP